jgi:hypothetical protein
MAMMLSMGISVSSMLIVTGYLHLVSRKKALDVAQKHFKRFKKQVSLVDLKSMLKDIKCNCSSAETRWDTRLPTGGIGKALELATKDGLEKMSSFVDKLMSTPWQDWRPYRLNGCLSGDVAIYGYKGEPQANSDRSSPGTPQEGNLRHIATDVRQEHPKKGTSSK